MHVAALAVRESAGQLHSLRVGTFPSAAQRLVPDALAQLRADHPNLELALMHFEPPEGLIQLAAGEVDAVVSHRYPGVSWTCPTGVRTTTLSADPLMLMVSNHHPLASRSRVEIAQLRDEVFISGTATDANRVALAGACAGAGFTPHVAFETTDYAATTSLVRHGFAIAVVARLAWPDDNDGLARLSLRTQGGKVLARQILLAVRTGRAPALVAELAHHLTTASRPPGVDPLRRTGSVR
jgi:DNA-binding transcriptional LysR family regulator